MLETRTIAIQDRYGERFQHCWGCGPKNDLGLHLKTYPSIDGKSCISRIKLENAYTGGVPSNVFGGMIATIFDCHGTASAAWFAHHQKGLELTESTVIGRFITARLEIDYLSPSVEVRGGDQVVVKENDETKNPVYFGGGSAASVKRTKTRKIGRAHV